MGEDILSSREENCQENIFLTAKKRIYKKRMKRIFLAAKGVVRFKLHTKFPVLACFSVAIGLPKVGIKLLKLSHTRMFSYLKILFLVPLLFVAQSLLTLIFYHSSLFAFMLSIHNNLSAGAQNVTGAYVIMLVCRHLLTTRLHGKAAV